MDKVVISDKFKNIDKYVLNTFLVTKKMLLLNLYALFYLKWEDISNILIIMEKFKSFKIEDNNVLVKYNEIWNKIKKVISIKFHSTPIYDKKCIKTKVKTFNGVASTTFWDDEIPKRNVHYTCIALINIDSFMKMDK